MLMHGLSEAPRSMAILTISVSIVCTSWIAPFVEEYYFRGYLLPRLARFGSLAPLINGVLPAGTVPLFHPLAGRYSRHCPRVIEYPEPGSVDDEVTPPLEREDVPGEGRKSKSSENCAGLLPQVGARGF
jgi:hypothetical protein